MKNPLGFLFTRDDSDGKVPNREILSYAAGLAGQNISYAYTNGRLKYFYENFSGISNLGRIGNVFVAANIWDAINDPLVGVIVDRRNSKPYEKLRPFILKTPPIIGTIAAMMFLGLGWGEISKLVLFAVLYLIWDSVYSFQDVSLWGMIPLSSPHSKECARVTQWVSIGAGAGSAIAGLFPTVWDMLKNIDMDDKYIFALFGLLFSFGGEILSMRAYKLKERVLSVPKKDESFLQAILVLRHNPTLLFISLARFLKECYPSMPAVYFFQNSISFTENKGTAELIHGIISGAPGSLSIFFATKFADKLGGMKKLLVFAQCSNIVVRLITFVIGKFLFSYNSWGGIIVLSLLLAVANIPCFCMDIAHRSLTSDSIAQVELKTGMRTEGISFSMQNFTTKIAGGVRGRIETAVLLFLEYSADKYNAGLPQGEKFMKWAFPLFILGQTIGSVLYIIAISFVKDDKKQRDEIERQLKERKEAAMQNANVN